jgi:hypothetical protein
MKTNVHVYFSKFCHVVYEIMWKYMVEPDIPQMTVSQMRRDQPTKCTEIICFIFLLFIWSLHNR